MDARVNRKPLGFLAFALLLLAGGCEGAGEGAPGRDTGDPGDSSGEVPEDAAAAVVGAGCFWCVEAFYERLDGVHEAVSGYAGGVRADPGYKAVSRGETRHAEVVKLFYDPERISYRELIDFFWKTHDASRDDGVWPDFGPQYRSILLYETEAQKAAIKASRKAHEAEAGIKVATDIRELKAFYRAEPYHQDFAAKNPDHPYVRRILEPKLEKLGLRGVKE